MPLATECCARRNSSAPTPIGVTGPRPVTTTRFMSLILAAWSPDHGRAGHQRATSGSPLLSFRNEADCVTHGEDAFGLLIADLDPEFVLETHDQLHHVQGVGAEVLDEG